ncbi:hypothetical protein [Pannonibacter sp.]|uniref:hypothetical protein n=1 Tax=Pannonibacter sp. TaxID=1906786 RepID=UPI003F72D661
MARISPLASQGKRVARASGVALLLVLVSLTAVSAEGQALKAPALVTGDDPQRFALVEVEGEYLRLDRRLGDISTCKKLNDVWRCSPAPDAELAYLAEIERLSAEVTELKARLASLGMTPSDGATPMPLTGKPEQDAPKAETPKNEPLRTPRLSEKDEKELEEVLGFTEMAMRRFFGLMREFQQDLDGTARP